MREKDIRNADVLNRYLELVQEDCREFFNDKKSFTVVNCPACGGIAHSFEYNKNGFDYVTCNNCRTLYARTRLTFESLKQFYSQSASTEYWVKEFFTPMVEARREKIFKPRAEYLVSYFGQDRGWQIGDIGAGFGLFLEELRKLWPASNYVAIEPSMDQAKICEKLSVQVECCTCEELKGYDGCFELLTAFELLEHLFEPALFLEKTCTLLKPGGYLFLTTLNGEGFDILTLREMSKSVSPPHHLNFFNPVSLELLLKKTGFDIIDISTPGKLDWDIVEGMIMNEKVNVGSFWELFAEKGTLDAKKELQDWISRHGFSSHMRILARKRT